MKYVIAATTICLTGTAMAASHGGGWTLEGFSAPESAYYDAGSGQIVVSNIGTFGPDGGMDGALSLVSPEGEMIAREWVTGLMDPKGMASADGKLYVADAMGLHVVDVASGVVETTITLEGAQFPNDVAIGPDGAIYVTDMFGGAIYRVVDGAADQLVPAGSLSLPNGIWAEADRLIVGSMGKEFSMETGVKGAGALMAVDYATGTLSTLEGGAETGAIDGVVEVNGAYIFSDNPTGEIVSLKDGALTVLATTESGAADIGLMDGMLLVPLMQGGKVMAMGIE